jgi:hypothetical protein
MNTGNVAMGAEVGAVVGVGVVVGEGVGVGDGAVCTVTKQASKDVVLGSLTATCMGYVPGVVLEGIAPETVKFPAESDVVAPINKESLKKRRIGTAAGAPPPVTVMT